MSNDLANIGQFHKCVAVVLNLMYEHFPNPINIDTFYIEDRSLPKHKRALVNYDDEMNSWEEPGNNSERNPIKSELAVYKNTVFFLLDEGYIQSEEPTHGQGQRLFRECKLTSKGLTALGRLGVREKINLGRLLHSAIKDGKYKVLQDLAVKVLASNLR